MLKMRTICINRINLELKFFLQKSGFSHEKSEVKTLQSDSNTKKRFQDYDGK